MCVGVFAWVGVSRSMVVPDEQLGKIAYNLYFDRGLDASAIQRFAMPTYGYIYMAIEYETNSPAECVRQARQGVVYIHICI